MESLSLQLKVTRSQNSHYYDIVLSNPPKISPVPLRLFVLDSQNAIVQTRDFIWIMEARQQIAMIQQMVSKVKYTGGRVILKLRPS
ncbi:MAG: hypothetical protein KDK64_07595 [Chlamydiia bacterium]|nr:hypothetical protein [Chlamydiia bacterium]